MSFEEKKRFHSDELPLVFCGGHSLRVISKNLPNKVIKYSYIFFSSFMVLGAAFRSMIHSEWLFVYGVR